MKRALLLTLATLACNQNQASVHDAAADQLVADTAPGTPDGPPTLAVDFAIEGCPSFDAENQSCTGTVPLTLQFIPLVNVPVTQYYWNFGDVTATSGDTAATPSHVYTLPGVYAVYLGVQSATGQLGSRLRTAFVTVTANALGDPCDADQQCEDNLFCLCPAGSSCDYGPPHGTCTALCQSGTCAAGQVCAGLVTAQPASGIREPWQSSLCLRSCRTDADCSDQLHCRILPPGVGDTWVNGCFSDIPADVGASCLDATGALRDDLCASGICANLGAKGMCTMACSGRACPPGSDCATLGDGRKLCLHPCSGKSGCPQDPLLDCLGPGLGDLGYEIVDANAPNAAVTHCAPKECASDADCLPFGKCDGDLGSSHCVQRSN